MAAVAVAAEAAPEVPLEAAAAVAQAAAEVESMVFSVSRLGMMYEETEEEYTERLHSVRRGSQSRSIASCTDCAAGQRHQTKRGLSRRSAGGEGSGRKGGRNSRGGH